MHPCGCIEIEKMTVIHVEVIYRETNKWEEMTMLMSGVIDIEK